MSSSSRRGQSLIELLVGITIGVLFITAAIGLITVSLRIDFQNKFSQTAGELNQELVEQLTTFASSDWHNIDTLTRATEYSFLPNGSGWFTTPAAGPVTITPTTGDTPYDVSFIINDVYRASITDDTISETGVLDPSLLKVTAKTQWNQSGQIENLTLSKYLARTQNRVWQQTDWSGTIQPGAAYSAGDYPSGADSSHYASAINMWRGATLDPNDVAPGQLKIASTTQNRRLGPGLGIDPAIPNHYAWNDVIGWFDFASGPYPVTVTDTALSGTVWVGGAPPIAGDYMVLDCSRTPVLDICGGPAGAFGVTQDPGHVLHGYAWSPTIGWVSFNSDNCDTNGNGFTESICGGDDASTAAPSYGVSLSGAGVAEFSGWAWNDVVGWISFNCSNTVPGFASGTCGAKAYRVKTKVGVPSVGVGELVSPTFDTERVGGAAFNTLTWLGNANGGTVQFKIATSNCSTGEDNYPACDSGTWSFVGPDSSNSESYYEPSAPDVPVRISRLDHNNKRYLRYTIYLLSDASLTSSPVVDDVLINWSR